MRGIRVRRDTETALHVTLAICLWIALAAPGVRDALTSSMALHMLVQLPLLAATGYCAGRAWARARPGGGAERVLARLQCWNAGGLTGLVVAGFVMVFWMLPRFLDLARVDEAVDAVKFLSAPAAGLALAISWSRCPAIGRAVVHLEVIATLLRFGWGYLAAEQRLCLAYLADDQQRAGTLLLVLGTAYAIAVTWRPMFGGRRATWQRARPGLAAPDATLR